MYLFCVFPPRAGFNHNVRRIIFFYLLFVQLTKHGLLGRARRIDNKKFNEKTFSVARFKIQAAENVAPAHKTVLFMQSTEHFAIFPYESSFHQNPL